MGFLEKNCVQFLESVKIMLHSLIIYIIIESDKGVLKILFLKNAFFALI